MSDSNPHDETQDLGGTKSQPGDAAPVEHPERIGRYRIEKVLGKGGFGLVYLAQDEQLDRPVAVKVPHAKLISKPADAEAYLTEARTVANLDHPGIVPVYDVGGTEDFPCYVVSKYIEGTDLSARIKERRLTYRDAAELVATIAEALHYAHKQGLVHRDVKPGNILIGKDGTPYVVDFGLALREENVGKGPKYAGTPAYMSPEQARGEGHRVDGRSDIFSLGVVFYELLAGRQPFRGDTQAELFEQVTSYEAKPLRQYDEKLPKELERICHKAMAKRASERYSSAHDLAEDLRLFLAEQTVIQSGASPGGVASVASETVASQVASTSLGSVATSSASMSLGSSDSQPIKIVPKGLRSFDAHDADFFLELLPGPRDRDGLPDSLRFWKTRIEEGDADNTFSVGLIYGPSGCGKSSLVKAGLLPRLSEDVIPVYIEATPEETETRLLHGLRKRCPGLEDNLTLKDTLTALRRGQGIPVGKKVVIVLDQFEQWLHAKKEEENTDLVQALRQCDGGRVQCIVMVRDDFWLAVSRFLRELEIRLVEGENSALTDLFDLDHARKVLAAFGRAFGKLPEIISETTQEQKDFLKQSVAGLAEEGKVICVRLALFAEMMKGKTWTAATLKEVGGTKGVGVTFLEETFSASTSPPEHRYHQKAARAVLKDLLPDSGTDIKGYMRSHAELLEASGYGGRPKDFDDLVRILDSEIRLITPTDPEGKDSDDDSVTQTQSGQKYFQLTHDYLVHSLRDWLTRKQKETRRGRAELKLFDASVTWNAKPENRFLPSWWEHLTIRLLSDKKKWTEPQRKMMGKAGRVHGMRSALVLVALVAVVLGGLTIRNSIERGRQELLAQQKQEREVAQAAEMVKGLLQADTSQVKTIIGNLSDYRQYAKDDLSKRFAESRDDSNAKLHSALAMLPEDNSVLAFLKERLLTVSPMQFEHVRSLLADHKSALTADYWEITTDSSQNPARRFQAACTLASYDPENELWQDKEFVEFIAGHLVGVLPSELLPWRNALRPVKEHLTAPLAAIYRDDKKGEQVRGFATDTLADYLRDNAEGLFDLLADANDKQFSPMFTKLTDHRDQAIELGNAEVAKTAPQDASEADKEALAMRQANAAVMLLRMEAAENVWPLFKHSPDPRVRSYIIHWLSPRGGDPKTLIARYEQETDVTIKRALLLCLGEFDESRLPQADRDALIETLLTVYRSDPDAGLHAAAEWLLRKSEVTLPKLPAGEPVLPDSQKQQVAKLTAEIADIRQRMAESEKQLSVRQAAWERKLSERPELPASLSEGLAAHFPLDETEGQETVNAVEGQPVGAYAGPGQPQWVPGVVGQALQLDGKGGHFKCGESFAAERTDAFSYGCWFLADKAPPLYATLIAKMDSEATRGIDLGLYATGMAAHFRNERLKNDLIVKTAVAPSVGNWHHVLMTYDGSSKAAGVTIYLDGVPVRAAPAVDSLSKTIQNKVPLHIGMRSTDFPFQGRIDDVRVYNRLLSKAEIQQLFQAGLKSVVGVPTEKRTPQQQALLATIYRSQDEPLRELQTQLSAAETALRGVGLKGMRRWYINGQGQTFVILDGGEFQMGSPDSETGRTANESLHRRQIGRRFAISAKEVTRAQWRMFVKSQQEKVWAADQEQLKPYIRTDDSPMVAMTWYEAAWYCNWLSEQEGIPQEQWCYEPNEKGQYGPGMKAKQDFWKLTGYRLPTEAEWEFACRAGASTSRYYGLTENLLPNYAWYQANGDNHSWPVANLKPNDFGLFDMQGNAFEWVYDTFSGSPSTSKNAAADAPNISAVSETVGRVLRGGSFSFHSSLVRSAYRNSNQPGIRLFTLGFRPARTYHLSP